VKLGLSDLGLLHFTRAARALPGHGADWFTRTSA
jgi:hypothetical protein